MIRLLDRKPDYEATVYAEAQALVDDGLDVEFVLQLFPADAAWLRPLLDTSEAIIDATHMEQPTYYFENALKQKFFAAAHRKQKEAVPLTSPQPVRPFGRTRTAFAAAAVAGVAAVAGIITLGAVTSDGAQPGDWRYVFRGGNDRFDVKDGRANVDIQLREAEARVKVIEERITTGGDVSQDDLQDLQEKFAAITRLTQSGEKFDPDQQSKLKSIGESAPVVLSGVKQKQPQLSPQVNDTINTVNEAVAAGTGGVKPVDTGTATASASATTTPTPGDTATPSPSASATPSGTATPSPTETPTPTPTETPTPSATASATPNPTNTPAPEATATANATR